MGLYENLLKDLANQLNSLHGTSWSIRYWRILIGPWLGYFTQMLFDRWLSIKHAVENYEIEETVVLTSNRENLIPNCMADFYKLFVTDEWNHIVYADILKNFPSIICTEIKSQERQRGISPTQTSDNSHWVKRRLFNVGIKFSEIFTRDEDAFFINTYLPRNSEVMLSLRMRQIPQLRNSISPNRVNIDWDQRKWNLPKDGIDQFYNCARTLISQYIPAIYLEGYHILKKQTGTLFWPKKPKLIWTSTAHITDDVFKAWAAEKIEHGAPLAIGQHGGNYGVGLWSFLEEHDLMISDCYFSWGWSKLGHGNIKPIGILKKVVSRKILHKERKSALLVTATVPKLSYFMYSGMVSRQWLDYFKDQCSFIESLPAEIQKSLVVRLNPNDHGWDQQSRWHDLFPKLTFDNGNSDIDSLIQKCRIYISTYNSTTFLESIAMNVPTIMYWNPLHWELRPSAIPYFEDLKRVSIFHETPESAAQHIAAIWDDIDSWWNSPVLKQTIEKFKNQYCRVPRNLNVELKCAFHSMVASTQ
jgi:putative transferase (TIGR04331 family)